MADPRIKELRIKTGIVKRCGKEILMYQKEADQIKEKIKKMQAEGQDAYLIQKQDGLLQETLNVIPDCQKRFTNTYNELKDLVDNEVGILYPFFFWLTRLIIFCISFW
ncbi:unnamed protein product [Meganyctiphanes norvegica]|uniref:Tubulin-specific chaperone A n=1 Tax=Meganyctiphanes norvegica TaxID=48144 RepID=A0AAV2SLJ8_MEGNR